MPRRFAIIESPYSGDVETHLTYARRAMRDCFQRGEIPLASHALYTQPGVLDDLKPEERKLGMRAGWAFYEVLQLAATAQIGIDYVVCAVYTDYGTSLGMDGGVEEAQAFDVRVEYRSIGKNPVK